MRITFLLPYRCDASSHDRNAQLDLFMATMPTLLRGVECHYIVCEQSDDRRKFNKGAVVNAGFIAANMDPEELVCIHDIDLLPCTDIYNEYTKALPVDTVRHIGNGFRRYTHCKKYMGGVLLMRAKNFTAMNGFPNDFEGWGGVDDIMGRRIRQLFTVEKSNGTLLDLENLDSVEKKLAQLVTSRAVGRRRSNKMRFYHGDSMYTHGLSDVRFHIVLAEQLLQTTRIRVHLV